MPLYIPWLTETIKKRGVRYLLHHYLGQFFEEKLTLEQLSIDIYEGKGSIRNLALDVDGLNDELDFIPFRFLEGCLIGQISVEVPWSSLATDACRVELDGAQFYCRLKTSADATKPHCTESTLLSRSLMTSSMQMAEEIFTTEDEDDQSDCSTGQHNQNLASNNKNVSSKRKDANQIFEGLEMFAQLIDSVLRRTKLTARNTLFQIQPHQDRQHKRDQHPAEGESTDKRVTSERQNVASSSSSRSFNDDDFEAEPLAKSDSDSDSDVSEEDSQDREQTNRTGSNINNSKSTVEFFIKFFKCEEMIDQDRAESKSRSPIDENDPSSKSASAIPETITKLLTLEDVEMRIDGIPVSNLVGKHTITIKFNGQKSEISIFSGSPLLAVIGRKQLETFFRVFDWASHDQDLTASFMAADKDQKIMSPEDYAKIENQLLESSSLRKANPNDVRSGSSCYVGMSGNSVISNNKSMGSNSYYASTMQGQMSIAGGVAGAAGGGARRWIGNGELRYSDMDHQAALSSSASDYNEMKQSSSTTEPTLDHIEAFSCELKLPGIWLCILRDGEELPPLIKPYADSFRSFQSINKYIDGHIQVPHIRLLALKVALDLTATGTNIFLGDLDISEHLEDKTRMNQVLRLFHADQAGNAAMSSFRYKASVSNGQRDITIDLIAKTRVMFDPTIIDRIVFDYKLVKWGRQRSQYATPATTTGQKHQRSSCGDLNLTIRAQQFKLELLCPIPDLTPNSFKHRTQLRPQSFIFEFKDIDAAWQAGKLKITSNILVAHVKTQPMQADHEAVKFIEATGKSNNDKIVLQLEPSPSNLDNEFTNDIEQALNESSMYDSIYISQTTESKIPTDFFQIKRKVVRASFQDQQTSSSSSGVRISECDHEKILTPGDRQHLLDYLKQTVMSTRLSLDLYLPICELEFEDKEQLDLIYNRFGNDFVFWQPKTFIKEKQAKRRRKSRSQSVRLNRDSDKDDDQPPKFRPVYDEHDGFVTDSDDEGSEVSYHSMGPHLDENEEEEEGVDEDDADSDNQDQHPDDDEDTADLANCYDNEVTCKIVVGEMAVRFNHQSCAAKLKQAISARNFLLGVVIDVNKRPSTLLSMVADNLELSTDSETVLQGNTFAGKQSILTLTAEIKRPTKMLKNIKLATQLRDGLFNDFRTETYRRFWQSINVTDEPILGYEAPQIVTELHVDILNTCLLLVRDGARPSLLSIDELYLTSMVMEQTSQVMIRLIADEVSLYMKRDRQGLETMKNYICLIDSGLIDVNVKFGDDSQLEFEVINNVITVRVCQDSLNALCRLMTLMVRSSNQSVGVATGEELATNLIGQSPGNKEFNALRKHQQEEVQSNASGQTCKSASEGNGNHDALGRDREMNLLVDAMNDYTLSSSNSPKNLNRQHTDSDCYTTAPEVIEGERELSEVHDGSASEEGEGEEPVGRKTSDCLLDQSNPMLGDLFSQPLMPMELHSPADNQNCQIRDDVLPRIMDESGFFVIGDDDVGAGIIDKEQHDPVVRRLVEGPISIMENHFRMTRPRTIPETLAKSIERYVLEEMTLVVNLYGGRDFDDEFVGSTSDDASSSATTAATHDLATDQALEATNELLDSISAESKSIRSRAGSVACNRRQNHSTGDSISSSLKRSTLASERQLAGVRKKHLSEGSGRSDLGLGRSVEQRVRFGEGAVNLWESLDLMSAPDFLGTNRAGPNQLKLNSDSKQAGGTWRENDVCIQLTLSKVKLLYEVADPSMCLDLAAGGSAAESSSPTTAANTNLSPPVSWRFMLFIEDIEVKDRIAASDINKMLYEYCNESMPKRNTQMLTVKNIATINPSDGCEECDLRVSLKPLRLNIDQDTLLFLVEFCTNFCKSITKQQSLYSPGPTNRTVPLSSGISATKVITKPSPEVTRNSSFTSNASSLSGRVKVATNEEHPQQQGIRTRLDSCSSTNSTSTVFSDDSSSYYAGTSTSSLCGVGRRRTTSSNNEHQHTSTTTTTTTNADGPLPTHCHTDNLAGSAHRQQPIYIKSFTFSPDVPIRIDYHSKHLDFEQGALAGILMGLAHLDHSELVLRRVQAKHGMRGLDRVLVFVVNSWLSDIKRNQLPGILGGVGPMHSVIQLFQGMRDLVWMPIDHYRKDGRLVRGLQRGATSFSSSTAMAAINLVNRFISIVQCTAQIAHDIVTPPTGSVQAGSSSSRRRRTRAPLNGSSAGAGPTTGDSGSRRRHHYGHSAAPLPAHHEMGGRSLGSTSGGHPSAPSQNSNSGLNQPRNFCEGVAVGFTIIKEGFNDTARSVSVGMQAEDMRSAVGEIVRQIPSTLLGPIITATEGAQSVLVGIRNQIAPDARRDDQEKWKGRVRGK